MNTVIQALSQLLLMVQSLVQDWGLTIVFVTLLVKLILLPLSLKRKKGMERQAQMSKEIDAIKKKYKDNKKEEEKELAKVTKEHATGMVGCLLGLVQLPIMIGLYRAISSIPLDVTTTLVAPWLRHITLPDPFFIIPILSLIVHILPQMFCYVGRFKDVNVPKPNKLMIGMSIAMNVLFVSKVSAIIGIYWITSGVYSMVEQFVGYWCRAKRKEAAMGAQ